MNALAIYIATMILSLAIGTAAPPLFRFAKNYGKHKLYLIDPGTHDIQEIYARAPKKGGSFKMKNRKVEVPVEGGRMHRIGQRTAWLINAKAGSPLVVGTSGEFEGLDGRTWYLKNHDSRVERVHQSGAFDLEVLMKYALFGLVAVALIVIVGFIIVGSMLAGDPEPAASAGGAVITG